MIAQALRLFREINLEILNNVENHCRCCASLKDSDPELKCLRTIAPRKKCSSKQLVVVTEKDLADLFRDVVPRHCKLHEAVANTTIGIFQVEK